MNNFGEFISPEKAAWLYNKLNPKAPRTVVFYHERAKSRALCQACGQEPAWRFAGTGLCFSCTTGESDASNDYELKEIKEKT